MTAWLRQHPAAGVACALVAAILAVYVQTASFGFSSYDDGIYVSENPVINRGLTADGLREVLLHGHHLLWTPVTSISYMIGCSLYGLSPAGHHLTSVALHAVAALLLFAALRRLTGALWCSAAVAMLFAIHPLNVESVAWVSGRKNQLYAIFWMLSLLAYARYTLIADRPDAPNRPRGMIGTYALLILFHFLGLASKPTHLMLPVVLLLLDFWPLRRFTLNDLVTRTGWARILRLGIEKVPLLALSLAITVWTWGTVAEAGGLRDFDAVPLAERVFNTIHVYGWFIAKTLWPFGLTVHYPYPATPLGLAAIAPALLCLAALALAALATLRRAPWLAAGLGWFVVVLLPESGLLRANSFLMADRYAYVSQIGLFIALVWGARTLAERAPAIHRGIPLLFAVIAACAMVASARQAAFWRDDLSLFGHAAQVTPNSPVAFNSLGVALRRAGRDAEAEQAFLTALTTPGPFKVLPNMGLGVLYLDQGRAEEALERFSAVVSGNPVYAPAHAWRARALAVLGRRDEADVSASAALVLDVADDVALAVLDGRQPDAAAGGNAIGKSFFQAGRPLDALRFFSRAIAARPDYAEAHLNAGAALATLGDAQQAIAAFEEALRLDPASPEAHCNLGILLAAGGQSQRARKHLEAALSLRPDYRPAAEALAQLGRE